MDSLNNELLKLSSFEPESLFKKLADFALVVNDLNRMPILNIALSSGQVVNGRLVKYHEGTRNATMVVTADNATHAQATFINLMHVVAISIANITQHAHLFSEGRIAVPIYYEKLTKLGFKKELTDLSDKINAATGLTVAIEADFSSEQFDIDLDNYTIKKLAETTHGALQAIANDPLGKESLMSNVKLIHFSANAKPAVNLASDGTLKILIDPALGEPGSFDVASLQTAIEAQL